MNEPDNYEILIGKINTFIRKYYLNNLLRGIIFLSAGIFSAFVVITVSEYLGNFSTTLRTILFYAFILLNAGLLSWLVVPSLMAWLNVGKTLTHDEAAEIIGRHFSGVNDKLLNTLQLKKLAGNDPRQRELVEASIDQKILQLQPVSFPAAVNIHENIKYIKWSIFPAAIICVIAFAAPSVITESTRRLIRHSEYFAPVSPFRFIVLNSSLSVVQGDDLALDLKLDGNNLPADVYIEEGSNTFKLNKESISRYHYLFNNLQQSTHFKLSANGYSSSDYEIKVNLKPTLLNFDVDLNYPAYLHKKNETLVNAGDLIIPAGTSATWKLHTQNASAVIFTLNERTNSLVPQHDGMFTHTEKILKNGSFKISPVNDRVSRTDLSKYQISVIADELPGITVVEKPDSVSLKSFYFTGHIQDDHGFSSLTFHYKSTPAGNKKETQSHVIPVKADLSQTQADFFYFWNLKDMHITGGDQVAYYFEVADNDGVNGPKKIRSPERTLNVPDERAVNEQLNAGTEIIKQKMQSAEKVAGQIEHEAQKLNEQLLEKNTLSFDEKKEIEQLIQKKQELDDLVKGIQAENRKNDFNRQENQKQNPALTQKQQQMEQLLNGLLDQKTQELLKQLQQLMQNNEKDATRDDLSKMQTDNKSLKKELDRMLELYKKLAFEQKLSQTLDQLTGLANKQEELAQKTPSNQSNREQLTQQQQKLKQDFQDIKKQLDDLQKANEQTETPGDFKNPTNEEEQVEQQMDKSVSGLQKNDRQQSSKAQQEAAKAMKEMASRLKQNDEQGEEQEANADASQLRELLKNLVNSSFEQEKVMQTLKTSSPADPNYIALAQKQKDIKDNLKTAEDSLYALSRRIPQIQSTVNQEISAINDHINSALEELGDRRTPEANRDQQYAMTSMNNLALMLSEALKQMQDAMKNAKGGKGKQKKMSISQLSQMQQQLSQNMQQMREQMQKQGNQGQSQHAAMSQQLAKMARDQQMIRQALDQINRDNVKDGKGGLGNLDKISQQMEQNEQDIVNRRITEEALKRQQQIQSRLLEAAKAEQQREQDQQRESNAGKEVPPGYIKALQNYQQLKARQTEQIRTVSPALNLYYKTKIKSYFDQLNIK
jgi:hypothetical protein